MNFLMQGLCERDKIVAQPEALVSQIVTAYMIVTGPWSLYLQSDEKENKLKYILVRYMFTSNIIQ